MSKRFITKDAFGTDVSVGDYVIHAEPGYTCTRKLTVSKVLMISEGGYWVWTDHRLKQAEYRGVVKQLDGRLTELTRLHRFVKASHSQIAGSLAAQQAEADEYNSRFGRRDS
jgi:hypothetical protein